jgi:hypothetical protein
VITFFDYWTRAQIILDAMGSAEKKHASLLRSMRHTKPQVAYFAGYHYTPPACGGGIAIEPATGTYDGFCDYIPSSGGKIMPAVAYFRTSIARPVSTHPILLENRLVPRIGPPNGGVRPSKPTKHQTREEKEDRTCG